MVGDFLSPESTVTCLLSSTGHLRSSLLPEGNTTFRYRDKVHSASALSAAVSYSSDDHCGENLNLGSYSCNFTNNYIHFLMSVISKQAAC